MSHYKNGREAINGDPVIGRPYGSLITGVIFGIIPTSQTCNCTVAQIAPGCVNTVGCVNVKDLFHQEDALQAIENNMPNEAKPEPTPAPVAVKSPTPKPVTGVGSDPTPSTSPAGA